MCGHVNTFCKTRQPLYKGRQSRDTAPFSRVTRTNPNRAAGLAVGSGSCIYRLPNRNNNTKSVILPDFPISRFIKVHFRRRKNWFPQFRKKILYKYEQNYTKRSGSERFFKSWIRNRSKDFRTRITEFCRQQLVVENLLKHI